LGRRLCHRSGGAGARRLHLRPKRLSRAALPCPEIRRIAGRIARWQFQVNATERSEKETGKGAKIGLILRWNGKGRFQDSSRFGLHRPCIAGSADAQPRLQLRGEAPDGDGST
jgi:hypothetical protein